MKKYNVLTKINVAICKQVLRAIQRPYQRIAFMHLSVVPCDSIDDRKANKIPKRCPVKDRNIRLIDNCGNNQFCWQRYVF